MYVRKSRETDHNRTGLLVISIETTYVQHQLSVLFWSEGYPDLDASLVERIGCADVAATITVVARTYYVRTGTYIIIIIYS
jgi:hypothetical protein